MYINKDSIAGYLCVGTLLTDDYNPLNDSLCTFEKIVYTKGIEEFNQSKYITISPNPFNDRTLIKFYNPDNNTFDLILSDVTGEKVIEINNITSDQVYIEKGNLKPGIYMVELKSNSIIFNSKLILTD